MVTLVNDTLPGREIEASERRARVLAEAGWKPKPARKTKAKSTESEAPEAPESD